MARVRVIARAGALLMVAFAGASLGGCELLTSVDYTAATANPCPEGTTVCNDGNCFDLKTTQLHCGACGRVCPGGATCIDGECRCPIQNLTLCTLGCFDLETDLNNCGACGRQCAGYPCNAGRCETPACLPPKTMCESRCVDVANDPQNCGSCGRHCFGSCISGICLSEPADASFDVDVVVDAGVADAMDGASEGGDAAEGGKGGGRP